MENIKDSSGKLYIKFNGTCYNENTPESLINVLDNCLTNRNNIRVYLGDTKTGIVWNEEHDTIGHIGRSTGSIKIPLLVHSGAYGGGALLSNRILKIVDIKTKRILYQVSNFIAPIVEIKERECDVHPFEVYINNELYGRCKTLRQAKLLKTRMS